MNINKIIDSNFRGCVLVRQNGSAIIEKAMGYADLSNEIPNTLTTKFATASAGKVFVAVAILQLIENNKLKFSDALGELLDFNLQSIDPLVTVEQLLTHTAGVPDYFNEEVMNAYEELWVDYPNYKIRTNSDLLPLFVDKPMMYQRGDKFQYNNTGFVLLAMIIEKCTKVSFDEYLKTNVFDVCAMKNTGYYELDRLPAKCANNYIWDEVLNEYRTNIYSVDVKGTGAGGAFTTVIDIMNFWECLLNHQLLSQEMTKLMLTRQSGDEEEDYGYGIWLIKRNENQYIPYFQGCDPGVSFFSEFDSESNTMAVLVSNYGDNVWSNMIELRNNLYRK